MKLFSFSYVAIILFTVACGAKEVSTFGLTVDYVDGRPRGGLCQPAGNNKSSGSIKLDLQKASAPNVWLDVGQNFEEESTYFVRAYVANGYKGSTLVPSSREELFERRYDEAFANSGKTDTFDVSFEGKTYQVAVKGLPGQTPCPKFDSSLPDGGLREEEEPDASK